MASRHPSPFQRAPPWTPPGSPFLRLVPLCIWCFKFDSRPSKRPKLQIAADEGNKAALNGLGYILVSGEDGESNYTGAAHYFKLAADKGHADGRYNLGILLMTGHGVRSRPPCQDPRLL